MRVSQRQVVIALLIMLLVSALIALIYQLFIPDTNLTLPGTIASLVIITGMLIAYWRGWENARYVTLIVVTVLIGLVTTGDYMTEKFSLGTFLPPALAMIVAGPLWVIGSAVALLIILIVRSGGHGVYTDPMSILLFALPVGVMLLSRLMTDTAQREAMENATHAREAQAHAEAQAQELVQKTQQLEAQNKQQRQLLDLVNTLETPAVSLAEGVLLAPVVGHLDSRRAGDLTRRLLSEVSAQRAKMVILDIAGVATVDTAVAQSILRAIQAIRLLGCEVTVTGISSSVAATMTELGINMAGVRTARTPQEVMGNDWLHHPRPSKN
jgi:rsbT co-antagonist protein RsbR